MPTMTLFNCFLEDLAEGKHNLGADTIKIALTNTAPVATNEVFADIAEISAGNGYTAGGTAIANVTSTHTSGTYKFTGDPVVFTASGGAIATSRYQVVYNDTSAGKRLIGWYDYGSSFSIAAGETFTITPNALEGYLQLEAA